VEPRLDEAERLGELRERFGLEPTVAEGAVRVYVPHGDQFIPQLFAKLDVAIEAVNLARPTLDDVFMAYTGRTIREAEATPAERLAQAARMHGRRR
jgi:ABC-2 type transport system ATP-binding protein